MRSALTALGIIIGVAAVITMLAVGEGAKIKVAEQLKSLGSNLMVILPGTVTSSGVRLSTGSRNTLTEGDAQAIQNEIANVVAAAPAMRGTGQVVNGNLNWSSVIYGITPDYLSAREWRRWPAAAPWTTTTCAPPPRSPWWARRWPRCCSAAPTQRARPSGSSTCPSPLSGCWRPRARATPARTRTTRC
jgi:hypothetical protein